MYIVLPANQQQTSLRNPAVRLCESSLSPGPRNVTNFRVFVRQSYDRVYTSIYIYIYKTVDAIWWIAFNGQPRIVSRAILGATTKSGRREATTNSRLQWQIYLLTSTGVGANQHHYCRHNTTEVLYIHILMCVPILVLGSCGRIRRESQSHHLLVFCIYIHIYIYIYGESVQFGLKRKCVANRIANEGGGGCFCTSISAQGQSDFAIGVTLWIKCARLRL